jgi:hypothetical protein
LKEDIAGSAEDVVTALGLLALPARGCAAYLTVRVAALRHTSNTPRHD